MGEVGTSQTALWGKLHPTRIVGNISELMIARVETSTLAQGEISVPDFPQLLS